MAKTRIQLGREGEAIIDAALRKQHYTIIERNWCAIGEVDLIAKRDGEWYFVEVRTRSTSSYISPEQGLTFYKRERMDKVARTYIGQHTSDADAIWHLSFAAVIVSHTGKI